MLLVVVLLVGGVNVRWPGLLPKLQMLLPRHLLLVLLQNPMSPPQADPDLATSLLLYVLLVEGPTRHVLRVLVLKRLVLRHLVANLQRMALPPATDGDPLVLVLAQEMRMHLATLALELFHSVVLLLIGLHRLLMGPRKDARSPVEETHHLLGTSLQLRTVHLLAVDMFLAPSARPGETDSRVLMKCKMITALHFIWRLTWLKRWEGMVYHRSSMTMSESVL